jgi:hypothetical protein
MKKVISYTVAMIGLYSPAAFCGVSPLDGGGTETLPIAAASDYVYCPECGAKNEAGAAYCANCGKKLPKLGNDFKFCPQCGEKVGPGRAYCGYCGFNLAKLERTRPEENTWEQGYLTLSGGIGAWFGRRTCVALSTDIVFNVSDHFVFGPGFSYFFHGDGSGYLVGAEFRPYIIPYSRSYFLKPHATLGVGFGREKIDVSWRYYIVKRWYVRPGAGLDVRISESRLAPYFNWAGLILIRGNFKDPWQLEEDQITGTAFIFEGGVRITF